MRVGVLTTSYPRFAGDGAGGFVAGFARWLVRAGHDVEVCCADAHRPIFYRGGAPVALARHPLRAGVQAAAFSTALAAHAWRGQRDAEWDAVVSHWLVPSALVALPLPIPQLAIAHGSDVTLLRRLRADWLVRTIARRADLVYVAESLRVAGAPGRVVAMGVDVPVALARVANSMPTLLYLGRLIAQKGVDWAIAARPAGARLIIAGEGPEERALRQLAGRDPDVTFVGAVFGAEKEALLAAADVLVVPSRVDGAPVVVSEALAVGVPVVATRVGGLPELIRHGVDGLLCEPNEAALRAALSRALAEREQLAMGAQASGAQRDWSVVGPRLWQPFVKRFDLRASTNRGSLRITRC